MAVEVDEDGNCSHGMVPEWCALCKKKDLPKVTRSGPIIEASRGGTCDCGCDEHYPEDTRIAYSAEAEGWVLVDHSQPRPIKGIR